MAEPENHTLHLLRDIRTDIKNLDRKIETLVSKVERNHADLKDLIDGLSQAFAGEVAART